MSIELKVPAVGESITEVQIGTWLKREGQQAEKDEALVEIETDKATVELPSPIAGRLERILKQPGETAAVGEVIGYMAANGAAAGTEASPAGSPPPRVEPPAPQPVSPSPATKQVVAAPTTLAAPTTERALAAGETSLLPAGDREEEIVPMSPIRRRIAQRLVEAQQTAALLTTFNEIDMSAVMELRTAHRDTFQQRYDVKLGFMSFFVKATVDALKHVPQVNAEVRGHNVAYRNYYDIGIAVGGGKGLVVPVLRNAERLSFAEIELAIADFGRRARDNKLTVEELQGGTFTISNGGIYGSLLSTPIVNPPQSGILGLHAIQERPIALNGQVVIRPMMYVALTYDHRIVDGREAVTFLRRIKEVIEQPMRLLIEV